MNVHEPHEHDTESKKPAISWKGKSPETEHRSVDARELGQRLPTGTSELFGMMGML